MPTERTNHWPATRSPVPPCGAYYQYYLCRARSLTKHTLHNCGLVVVNLKGNDMDDGVAAALPSPWSLLQGLLALLIVWGAYRAAQTFWLRPRRLDRALRAQGLTGTEYCFPAGDLKENARLNDEARSRPMPPCHDVVPRVMPHLFNTIKEHGTSKVSSRSLCRFSTSINSLVRLLCLESSGRRMVILRIR